METIREKRIEQLTKEIEYEKRKMKCCVCSKSDEAYLDFLEEKLEKLKELEDDGEYAADKLGNLLYNAIVSWYENSLEQYNGLDDEDFVEKVCTMTGLRAADYYELFDGNDGNWDENMLHNAIVSWYENSLEQYNGLDDEEFIEKVCDMTGLTQEEYEALMNGNTEKCSWNLEIE